MSRKYSWYLRLALILVLTSVVIFSLQVLIFKDVPQTGFYFFQDLAFLPIEVLLVAILVDRLMKKRDKNTLMNKMNLIIGIFFSEMGYDLLKHLYKMDKNTHTEIRELGRLIDQNPRKSSLIVKSARQLDYGISLNKHLALELKRMLVSKKTCLTRLLENPNLLEHDSFTDLLWAISHLLQELMFHDHPDELSDNDIHHLQNDVRRAYSSLVVQWMSYMIHLKRAYPYIYSLYERNNPFNQVKD